jgi:DNA-binding CsgD family transcriptional regulator
MTDEDWSPSGGAVAFAHLTGHGVLTVVQRRLNGAQTVSQLLSLCCDEAPAFCGFARALVLGVEGRRLTATGLGVLADAEADVLRRRVLAEPIEVVAGSLEAEVLRGGARHRGEAAGAASVVRERLGLGECAMAAVIPEATPVALLVLDRPSGAVTAADQAGVDLSAHLLGLAIERLVLRSRLRELSSEFRHLTTSAHALLTEALEAPVGLQSDFGHGPVFTTAGRPVGGSDGTRELLTDREREVAALMALGQSNKEIGDALHLSPDTVKASVGRLARKLGASNRVEAVARYVMLTRDDDAA